MAGGASGKIWYVNGSPGGTWSNYTVTSFGTNSVGYIGYANGTWVIGGDNGALAYSTDITANSWTYVAPATSGFASTSRIQCGASDGTTWALGADDGKIRYTTDFASWTSWSTAGPTNAAIYDSPYWVFVGYVAGYRIWSSQSVGGSFTSSTPILLPYSITRKNGYWAIAGDNATAGVIYSANASPNSTYTAASGMSFFSNIARGVDWGGGVWVATGYNKTYWSTNLTTWTQTTMVTASQLFDRVTFGNGAFVCAGRTDFEYAPIGIPTTTVLSRAVTRSTL